MFSTFLTTPLVAPAAYQGNASLSSSSLVLCFFLPHSLSLSLPLCCSFSRATLIRLSTMEIWAHVERIYMAPVPLFRQFIWLGFAQDMQAERIRVRIL